MSQIKKAGNGTRRSSSCNCTTQSASPGFSDAMAQSAIYVNFAWLAGPFCLIYISCEIAAQASEYQGHSRSGPKSGTLGTAKS